MKIVSINCRFCDASMGNHVLPDVDSGVVVTLEDLGIADTRCDSCEALHGNFKEMSLYYHTLISEDTEAQRSFMMDAEYKLENFVDKAIFDHPEVVFITSSSFSSVESIKESKITDLGLDALTPTQRVEVVTAYRDEYPEAESIDTELVPPIIDEVTGE